MLIATWLILLHGDVSQRTLAQGLVTQGSATLPVLMRDPLFVEAASKCGVEV